MTRPTVVILCPHGEAKPHSWAGDGIEYCPGGRVLQQAIIIERGTDGEWPESVIEQVMDRASFRSYDIIVAILDALASAQPEQEA